MQKQLSERESNKDNNPDEKHISDLEIAEALEELDMADVIATAQKISAAYKPAG